jgi:hypothetical protein
LLVIMYYTINKEEEDILFCKWVLCENLEYCFFVHTLVLFTNGDVVLLVIMYYTINKEEDILFCTHFSTFCKHR